MPARDVGGPAQAFPTARRTRLSGPISDRHEVASRAGTCTGCHGADLAGGPIPGAPPDWPAARNITPHPTAGIGRWTEADFERLLASGVRPDGRVVDTVHMPVRMTRAMTPVERQALWAYLRTVPAARRL